MLDLKGTRELQISLFSQPLSKKYGISTTVNDIDLIDVHIYIRFTIRGFAQKLRKKCRKMLPESQFYGYCTSIKKGSFVLDLSKVLLHSIFHVSFIFNRKKNYK